MTGPPARERTERTGRAAIPGATSVLVVDDDPVTCATLRALLTGAGYDVSVAADGREALEVLKRLRVRVVISDWYMPGMDGTELCRQLRGRPLGEYVYFILITSNGGKERFLAGMDAGADDFITKPVDPDELRARIRVAERILGLQQEVYRLEGLLPICSYCKRIRDDAGGWSSLERFIERRTEAQFSHGICDDCYSTVVQPQLDRLD